MKKLSDIDILRYEIAKAAARSKEGHIASAYSILDILWVLYKNVIKLSKDEAGVEDKFILSKGHASLALYAIFLAMDIIDLEEFQTFGDYDSRLGGHPDSNKMREISASTGSLGHGLPICVGMAMALKINQQSGRIFCLVGDGECNEGAIWEAALLAAHHKLQNLFCIVDFNHSTDRALELGDLSGKFSAFGWDVIQIDGHNHVEILNALQKKSQEKPVAIIAETIKGKGVKMMEGDPSWHHRSPTEADLKTIFEDLSNHA
jgi:transketolase